MHDFQFFSEMQMRGAYVIGDEKNLLDSGDLPCRSQFTIGGRVTSSLASSWDFRASLSHCVWHSVSLRLTSTFSTAQSKKVSVRNTRKNIELQFWPQNNFSILSGRYRMVHSNRTLRADR